LLRWGGIARVLVIFINVIIPIYFYTAAGEF